LLNQIQSKGLNPAMKKYCFGGNEACVPVYCNRVRTYRNRNRFGHKGVEEMKKHFLIFMLLGMFFILMTSMALAAEKAPQKIMDLTNNTLAPIGTDPIIIEAVKAENAKGKSMDEIKAMDEKWKNTAGVADFMRSLMDSACGKHIREFQKSQPYFSEIFVMDNQGANVAMTDKTTDYWQGDEAKFQKSFNNGAGAVFVDEVEFDESTQTYLVQVSVPVMDGDKAIGSITFGIDVEQVK
jgi:hypothetical protein